MNIENFTVYQKTVPERKAVFQEFPSSLHPDIREFLKLEGIPSLYSHQAEMFEKAREGKNVVITTSTASGKTLSFLLPVLQEILKNPLTRAVFVYPTKALATSTGRCSLFWNISEMDGSTLGFTMEIPCRRNGAGYGKVPILS